MIDFSNKRFYKRTPIQNQDNALQVQQKELQEREELLYHREKEFEESKKVYIQRVNIHCVCATLWLFQHKGGGHRVLYGAVNADARYDDCQQHNDDDYFSHLMVVST